MGRKGESKGLKRKPAPKFWPIHRKESVWVVKPSPGPHATEKSLPLAIILRDILGFAKTRKEAKTIVANGKVYVDGKIRREDNFPVGPMDVITIPEANQYFRILPAEKGLILQSINKEETTFKLCRIEDKIILKGGHLQLNLHDGSNIQIKVADPKNPLEDIYKTFDTVKVSLPDKQILEHIKMKEGCYAIITGGKNVGKYGKIVEIESAEAKKRRNALVTLEDENGNRYQTILNFTFVVGENKPLIALPEVRAVV
ncbi:MAG: 30S ribosomal protein S4e [Candidatus Bathyarchaeia archaeon]|nr:MAG: 30S ribosomal protein S4e [Candidatus Bathyarchaeota archaeon]